MRDPAQREKRAHPENRPVELEPVPGDEALDDALHEIAEDARIKPRRYARDALVPGGGE